MKKNGIILILVIAVFSILLGIILSVRNNKLEKSKIEIIDATYSCAQVIEKFYEDDKYTYHFPCAKSSSTFVKFSNGKKMLVTKALDEKLVTIDELEKAGLKFYKYEK